MMKHLKFYYVLVGLPYVLLLIGAYIFIEPIKRTILNNPIPHLNYAIIVIVLTGGLFILNNTRRLIGEARNMREFSEAIRAKTDSVTLRELSNRYRGAIACILQLISSSGDRSISHQEQAALEHELVNARSGLVRRNALPQYLTGLLVAMGLLGTFIGLLATLADISVLIGGFADIDMNNIDPIQVFRVMIERMKAPMTSMGIAFSTSMFGLLGSIVIGLMMLGVRRLQGDIISVLSSEVARHIELALSFESISFRGGDSSLGTGGEALDLTAKILLRIEERLAESARLRQRALAAEIDDFKKQRADMLQALGEQTEANVGFREEMQRLGGQLAEIFGSMQKANNEISSQISQLTVNLAGDGQETHKLLGAQVEEQKKLKDTLDGYNIREWLSETSRMQQRSLSAALEDFSHQREEMLRALTEQTDSNKNSRSELQQIGSQLGSMFKSMERSSEEISSQISELTVHVGAEAKESHRLLTITNNNLRSELQQQGTQLVAQLSELQKRMSAETKESQGLLEKTGETLKETLQQHGGQLISRLAELDANLVASSRESQQQLETRLETLANLTGLGDEAVVSRIAELMKQLEEEAAASLAKLDEASSGVSSELQQLGSQLGEILSVTEKGGDELASQIFELTKHMSAEAKESQKLLAMLVKEDEALQDQEQVLRAQEQQA